MFTTRITWGLASCLPSSPPPRTSLILSPASMSRRSPSPEFVPSGVPPTQGARPPPQDYRPSLSRRRPGCRHGRRGSGGRGRRGLGRKRWRVARRAWETPKRIAHSPAKQRGVSCESTARRCKPTCYLYFTCFKTEDGCYVPIVKLR